MSAENASGLSGRIFGPHEIQKKIGEGGMGAVYLARDRSLGRQVAIKILPPELARDKTYVRRFVREAQSLAKISHPNLVHIYSVGHRDELYYYVMEYIEGTSLHARLRVSGPLGIEEFFRTTGQVLAALARVHARGIVHRDIKAGNVMLAAEDGRAVLMDFGLAKDEARTDLTSAGQILGTPEYMAPEQCEGEPIDARTDLYAMGILMFEALTGDVPFTGRSAIAVVRQQVEAPPPPAAAERPEVPDALRAIVARCLAKRPADRYATVAELAADLAAIHPTPELTELAGWELAGPTARTLAPGALSAATLPTMRHPADAAPRKGRLTRIALIVGGAVLLLLLLGALRGEPRRRTPPPDAGARPGVYVREGVELRGWFRIDETGTVHYWQRGREGWKEQTFKWSPHDAWRRPVERRR